MDWKVDSTLGYVYTIDKECPYSDIHGKVYQHHYVMCNHLGRALSPNECVHHIDRNRSNNDLSNLKLMTLSDHAKLHAIEDRGYRAETRVCKHCSKEFLVSSKSKQIYCTSLCSRTASREFDIAPEELHVLVWSMPTTEVAKTLGVSDVAVAKRCKAYGINKPPRGYWAKVKAGKL